MTKMEETLRGYEMFQMNYWIWWIAAVVLLGLEVFTFSNFLIWTAVASAITGFVLFFVPSLTLEYQLITFSVTAFLSLVLGRYYVHSYPTKSQQPFLNVRGREYVGRVMTLEEPIVDGIGKIRVGDTFWRIEGEDCAAGTQVKVMGVDSTRLQVSPVDK